MRLKLWRDSVRVAEERHSRARFIGTLAQAVRRRPSMTTSPYEERGGCKLPASYTVDELAAGGILG